MLLLMVATAYKGWCPRLWFGVLQRGYIHLHWICLPEGRGSREWTRSTHHINICYVIHDNDLFGSNSKDAMVLWWLFDMWCLSYSHLVAALMASTVGGEKRFSLATELHPKKHVFCLMFCWVCGATTIPPLLLYRESHVWWCNPAMKLMNMSHRPQKKHSYMRPKFSLFTPPTWVGWMYT
jgi:hypothetical protein